MSCEDGLQLTRFGRYETGVMIEISISAGVIDEVARVSLIQSLLLTKMDP